jgi:tight adherence protein B
MIIIVTVLFTFATAFVSSFLTVVVVEGLIERRSEDAGISSARQALDSAPLLLRDDSLSAISLWGTLLERLHFTEGLQQRIYQAQLNWTVGRLTAMMLFSGTVALVILSNITWMPLVGAITCAALAALAPYFYILNRRSRWMSRFEESFPDVLDGLCRALRAGHPLGSALSSAAAEAPGPVATELRKVVDEWKLGLPWQSAMDGLVRRVPLVDIAIFAAAVKLHTRTGGRLTEVLSKLSETMREAVALRGEVRAIAAQGKLTGNVLTALPVVIAGVMALVNPSYLGILAHHPSGKTVISAAVCSLLVARMVIRKMVDIRL